MKLTTNLLLLAFLSVFTFSLNAQTKKIKSSVLED